MTRKTSWYQENIEKARKLAMENYHRRMKNPAYRAERKERKRQYLDRHPTAEHSRYMRYKEDSDKYQELLRRSREWQKRNRSKVAKKERNWRKRNPEKIKQKNSNRRARENEAPGGHTRIQWLSKFQFHGFRCFYCFHSLTEMNVTKEHRIPLSRGGSDFVSNLVPACHSCNSKKLNFRSEFTSRPKTVISNK